jgi:hypothetical protein
MKNESSGLKKRESSLGAGERFPNSEPGLGAQMKFMQLTKDANRTIRSNQFDHLA